MISTAPLETITQDPAHQTATHCVIVLHGLGADYHDLASLMPALNLPKAIAARFVFLNAPIRPITINAGTATRAWYDVLKLDRGIQEDGQGIKASQQSIEQVILKQIQQGIPSQHIILMGFSQGGAMSLLTGIQFNQTLGGIIGLSCYLPLFQTALKQAHPANKAIPIMQMHGQHDNVLPISLAQATYQVLVNAHYPIEFKTYPMAHSICQEQLADLRPWLIQRLI